MQGGIFIIRSIAYQPTVHKGLVGEKEITVRHLIPIFENKEEREKQEKSVENGLYKIFAKYVGA